MSTLKMTMTPEFEAQAILGTAHKLSVDERDAMESRLCRALRAERCHAKLVEALRDAETLIASKGGYLATQAFETDRRVLASIRSALAAAGEA